MLRSKERADARQKLHEVSFDSITATGYDPTLDVINVPLKIKKEAPKEGDLTEKN